jgi:hypothetical protein
VAEIVTYRLQSGADPQAHLAAARQTMPFLRSTGAVINRTLSRDDTGLWTDHILWTSLKAAKQTEALAMQRPEFNTFFSMIDETGLTLGHAPVMLQMD